MAIEQLHPEVLAIEARLAAVYRNAQAFIDAQLAVLIDDPARFALRRRLSDIRERIGLLLRHVDVQAAAWVHGELVAMYSLGARDAAIATGAFTAINRGAVNELALGTLTPLLEATRHVEADVKRLMTKIADDAALDKVLGVRDLRGAQQRMAEVVETNGVSAAVYSDGTRMPIDSYAEMVIRTRTAVAYNRGTLDSLSGDTFVEIADGLFCGLDEHDGLPLADGMFMTSDEAANHLLSHPNAVMAETLVEPIGRLSAAYTAEWKGPLVRVATSGGTRLAVGPNHPVLTLRGWVLADVLRVGDHVFRRTRHRAAAALTSHADLDVMPSRVEDEFEALRRVGGYAGVVATAADLHGDGMFCQGEIEVVWAKGELARVAESQRVEQNGELIFDLAGAEHSVLPGASTLDLATQRIAVATSTRPRRGHVRRVGVAVSNGDPAFLETAAKRVLTDPRAVGNFFARFAGEVSLDEVVEVRYEESWSGQAFDLETSTGTYFADGIVVHNCRRAFLPRPDITDPETAQRIRQGDVVTAAP